MDYPGARYWVPSPNHSPRRPEDIRSVVIHTTQGPARDESGTVNKMRNTSAGIHYVVNRDGVITQMVRDNQITFHVGDTIDYWANSDSIGIEHVNTRGDTPTPALYLASAGLVRWLCERYHIPKIHELRARVPGIKDHQVVSSTNKRCPGRDWDWDHYMSLVAPSG